MPRYRQKYSILESKWGMNKKTNEVVGVRILYFDPQMQAPFRVELLRGSIDRKRMDYAIPLERAVDAHMAYQMFETYTASFLDGLIPLDPKDHPFIARMIREKEEADNPHRRYDPGADWRYRYGMPPVIFSSSFMRYFNTNPVMSTIGWLLLSAGAIFGIWVAL